MKRLETETSEDRIRVLAVAPYDGMGSLIDKEGRKFPELEIDTVIGNLEHGVELVQTNFHSDYDMVLSRGGTAELLREKVDIPVIEIPISFFDILRAIQLSANAGSNRAVVGFSSITRNVQMINDLLNLDLNIYTLVDSHDIQNIIPELKQKEYQAVICDVVSSSAVQNAGLNAILITSGSDSIDEALQSVISMARSMQQLRLENHFLRSVLREHSGETVVFNSNNDLYFCSFSDDNHEIIKILKGLIPEVHEGTAKHVWKSIKGTLYSIKSAVISIDNEIYTSYYFTASKTNTAVKDTCISYSTSKESENAFNSGFYHLTGNMEELKKALNAYNQTNTPVVVSGEYGTGRTAVASYIYTHSPNRRKSLVEIDCALIGEKSKDFLFNSQKSPMFFSGNTIHFKNMDQCSIGLMKEFLNVVEYTNLCQNNHVIFSGDSAIGAFNQQLRYIKDKFQCYHIQLQPLRDSIEQIPAIANLYLNYLNTTIPNEVLRIDRNAMTLLQNYSWPGNHIQFQRILSQAAINAQDHIIHENEIRQLLSQEREESGSYQHAASEPSISLCRPLHDIEKEIIEKVLKNNNGNQSLAAKQLGIGRTTMWRILKGE